MSDYDVIVVGGGHAGSEAASATARLGMRTALFCMSFSYVGNMPCNPSIGGSAKGIVVREIDALGGLMGRLADQHTLQIKMLNLSKGPGVHALRAQIDKKTYPAGVLCQLQKTDNLSMFEAEVKGLIVENQHCGGVILADGRRVTSTAVVLTTGTYLEAEILRGSTRSPSGPDGDRRSSGLAADLEAHGIRLFRLKTGTPPRLKRDSIDFSKLESQSGSTEPLAFSFDTDLRSVKVEEQVPCYLTYTTLKTHELILSHLKDSAMYGGYVTGVGPRYCPSIEDKIVRFKDKPRHQLFLEPESRYTDSYYLQGFSTSMPPEIQEKMVHTLPGLEKATILKYAYAIEYEAIEPLQFDHALSLRALPGLFAAGQIVGTSGYEEAAALGLIAGINAARYVRGASPFTLRRDEAYIGVMIDDLVTKGTREPYRLLSSRSEFRLLTRSDNALDRLFDYGTKLGLNDRIRAQRFAQRQEQKKSVLDFLHRTHVGKNAKILSRLKEKDVHFLDPSSKSLEDLIRSRAVEYDELLWAYPELPELDFSLRLSIFIDIRYRGYIQIEQREAERMKNAENYPLNSDLDYSKMSGLSLEAREKLQQIRPKTIGEAARITNVHPADINVLLLYLKK